MIFKLDFGYYVKLMHVPDGHMDYLRYRKKDDLIQFENAFEDWLDQHEEYVRYFDSIDGGQIQGRCFNEKAILRYVNEVILANSEEKAYFTSKAMLRKENAFVLYF